jgi:hypothetical protein
MSNDSMLTSSGASNGFWGSVGNVLGDLGSSFLSSTTEGLKTAVNGAASQLPAWAANQLGLDGDKSTVNPGITNPVQSSMGNLGVDLSSGKMDSANNPPPTASSGMNTTLLIIGAVVLVSVLVVMKR